MEKILELSMLYDFYSELLTDKQRDFFDRYYFQDLSLHEIAEELNISPQGVSDLIKRTEKILTRYESKLKLVENHIKLSSAISEIVVELEKSALTDEKKTFFTRKLESLL